MKIRKKETGAGSADDSSNKIDFNYYGFEFCMEELKKITDDSKSDADVPYKTRRASKRKRY